MNEFQPAAFHRFGAVAVRLSVELGRTEMPLRDVLDAHHRLGQGLRGEHVPPRSPRRDQQQRCGHLPLRKISLISPCGRERVMARSIPTVIPAAITDEPP